MHPSFPSLKLQRILIRIEKGSKFSNAILNLFKFKLEKMLYNGLHINGNENTHSNSIDVQVLLSQYWGLTNRVKHIQNFVLINTSVLLEIWYFILRRWLFI